MIQSRIALCRKEGPRAGFSVPFLGSVLGTACIVLAQAPPGHQYVQVGQDGEIRELSRLMHRPSRTPTGPRMIQVEDLGGVGDWLPATGHDYLTVYHSSGC